MKNLVFLVVLSAFATVAPAEVTPDKSAIMFGARESVTAIDLSPDGESIAFVAPGRGAASLIHIVSLADRTPKPIAASSGNPDRLAWCNFASNARLVCQIYATVDFQDDLVGVSRLYVMDRDGSNVKQLGQRRSFYDTNIRQFDGEIIDWLPNQGDALLMARAYVSEGRSDTRLKRTQDGLGVDRIDLRTLRSRSIEQPDTNAGGYLSDGRGNVRIMEVGNTQAGSLMAPVTDYYYRKTGSSDWSKLGSYDYTTREGMVPIAVDGDIDSAYVLRKRDGRFALYRIKLDGSMASELAYANDRVDVDDVVRVGRGQKVIGVTFAEEHRRAVYFDPEFKKLAESLGRAIPNLPLVSFAGASADGGKLLIHASSDSDPGRYYLFEKASRKLIEIMLVRPELEGVPLSSVKPVTYPAADGVQVPGYLTLPPGRADAKGLPAIVLPHGGPSSRDEWGFEWLAQFLAHEGYAVLQPNYRGSDGYGEEWLRENGFRGWRTSIGDISAGARWLVAQGADASRLAIVGWSYGGYAALQSAVVEPSLYQAVVAIAPVTDLNLVKAEARGFTNSALVADFVGSGPHVAQGSPLQNAERIAAPVLMFHGDRDQAVRVRQSELMHRRLEEAGKRSELTVYPGLGHALTDSSVRAQMLQRIADFLKAELK